MENPEEIEITSLTCEICIEPMENPNSLGKSEQVEIPILTCEICIEPMIHNKKFNNGNRCAHPFCTNCIARYIEAKVEDRVAEPTCPAFNCEKLLDPLSCRPILPTGLFKTWCNLLCDSVVGSRESAYCPFVDCSALILNECGRNVTRSNCPNCKKLLCFQCKLPWHAGFGCDETEEMRDENDILLGELVERNKWKICPSCKYRVERNEGCLNIKCRCGVLFCYSCGKVKNICECYGRNVVVEVEEEDGHMGNRGGVNVDDNTRWTNWIDEVSWIDGVDNALRRLIVELGRMRGNKVAKIFFIIVLNMYLLMYSPTLLYLPSWFRASLF
ncbi:hypothetical protein NE237_028736 [Protea cynaroides]|uniref:RBR-type E3 ubiquitin transferase n=1 Tax=Protea cynaroides TaxID=273540 RepID=A0A9Q0JT58_9MAGN|nr:hypothetical protein NE237_028736 [Protea cynaroides]